MKDESQRKVPLSYKDKAGRTFYFPAEWKNFTDYEKEEWNKIMSDSCPQCGEEMSEAFGSHRLFCQKCNRNSYAVTTQPSKLPPPSSIDRSGSQPGKPFIHSGGEMNKSYYDKQSQPPLTEQGKEEAADWEEMYWILNAEFEDFKAKSLPKEPSYGGKEVSILDLIEEKRKLQAEIMALKSSDGWSDERVIEFTNWCDNYYHSVELGIWMNVDGMPFGDNQEVKFITAELLDKYKKQRPNP